MINLRNDYCAIAHENVLKSLIDNSKKTFVGYGLDEISKNVEKIVRKLIKNNDAVVSILPGGTVTNKVMIGHLLKPYEAVICADTAHINVHETGAIESDGHKVIETKGINGKIQVKEIEHIVSTHLDEHMVKPKMVYISHPTELGSVYTLNELKEISKCCKENNLYLYVDGARLATGLTSKYSDITFEDLGSLVDAFYIGGTKNGLLNGEALVVNNVDIQNELRYSVKHFGGMYSKGFVTGIQFETLLKDGLLFEIGKHQNELAEYLVSELKKLNVEFMIECESNQIFPIFTKKQIEELNKNLLFEIWEDRNEKAVIRFVTHFLLTREEVEKALQIIKDCLLK